MLGKFEGQLHSSEYIEGGELVISFVAANARAARQCIAAIKQATQNGSQRLRVEVAKQRERRSLSANAYFHVLVEKIAEVLNLGADEVKRQMVLDYGTAATEGGERIIAELPKIANPLTYYPYAKWLEDYTAKNGLRYSRYLLYKRTHMLDKKEMARLVEGVIYEANGLGIETRTPDEIASLISLWEAESGI